MLCFLRLWRTALLHCCVFSLLRKNLSIWELWLEPCDKRFSGIQETCGETKVCRIFPHRFVYYSDIFMNGSSCYNVKKHYFLKIIYTQSILLFCRSYYNSVFGKFMLSSNSKQEIPKSESPENKKEEDSYEIATRSCKKGQ